MRLGEQKCMKVSYAIVLLCSKLCSHAQSLMTSYVVSLMTSTMHRCKHLQVFLHAVPGARLCYAWGWYAVLSELLEIFPHVRELGTHQNRQVLPQYPMHG
jgi:hypothetical protein